MKVKLINDSFKNCDYGRALISSRGVGDIDTYLAPTEENLQTWKDLENIEKGIDLIYNLKDNAKIGLIVDCDVDGYTSSAIIYQYLKQIKPNLTIEHYLHTGKAHGLEEHWSEISGKDYDLLIIPDAGSNDEKYSTQITCPILIIDHHMIDEPALSTNLIIINNQISPKYLNKDLSGAGMVYQFCRGLDEKFNVDYSKNYIDLAALGICGDMMSGLEIENQYFWRKGFTNINNFFFMSIAQKQCYSITGKMTLSDKEIMNYLTPMSVAFYIVPMINAMVRVGSQEEKERMFIAFIDGHRQVPSLKRGAKGTYEEAAIEAVRECVNARSHQNKFKEKMTDMLEQKILKNDLLENQILFIRLEDEEDFPSELNGLIATQLANKYKKPTIVARLNNEGIIRGSIRGVANSELQSFKEYLLSTGLFEYVQGHDGAAGCSINNKNLSRLHEIANKELIKYNLGEDYYEVNFERFSNDKDLTELISNLNKYKFVWSHKNQEALIYVKSIQITKNDIQIMGKNSDTVKIFKNGVAYMKFFATDMIQELNEYDEIVLEVVGKANLNEWNGTSTPQIFIENYEIRKNNILEF